MKETKELRDAAQAALEKTNVEHEQVLYTKLIAFCDAVVAHEEPAASSSPANTNTGAQS